MTIVLDPPAVRQHVVDMTEDGRAAIRRILREAPGSIRELARAAGVDVSLLTRIRDGERSLTPRTARAVSSALRAWGETCLELAEDLEAAAEPEPEGGDDG